jgi:hypothetical protein
LHRPNSRQLSIRLLSQKTVEEAWKQHEKAESPKEFETLQEFKVAIANLEGGFHRVMPWNLSFKALNFFLVLINFGEAELSGKQGRLLFLANFVDEVLRTNARNWEERKPFLSYQDLTVKWTADLTRLIGSDFPGSDSAKRSGAKSKQEKKETLTTARVPRWVCRGTMKADAKTKKKGMCLIGIRISS